MMLQALVAYAEREKLYDADFEPAELEWIIPLDANGRLASGPLDLRESPRDIQAPFLEQKMLTDAHRPRAKFLCDCLERTVGLSDENKADRAARRTGSLDFFCELL